ncbi:SDR family NAD(P)-dependent oxidoreductase [Yoonia sp. SS1-5]|uniref:SDR family NAD(P)-dependent oxidoreductase n=1 Tax=Yoonia rhodophyticola TaxID=3137370 RepID=A0AAN0MDV7_9RHOB
MPQRAFITGGAAGLGRALAKGLVADGWQVLIGDVDLVAGQTCADELGVSFIACDVRQAVDFEQVVVWVQQEWGGVDLVINNAGVAQMGPLEKTPLDDWQWIVDINFLGIVRAVKAFTPLFRAQGHGRYLNIASMAGFLYLPNAGAYNATKAAVVALSETMMLELEDAGIRTQVACPAFFRTDLARNMRAADDMAEKMTKRLVERSRLDADDIAAAIIAGMSGGDAHILTHPQSKSALRLKRWLPFERYMVRMRKDIRKLDARMACSPK